MDLSGIEIAIALSFIIASVLIVILAWAHIPIVLGIIVWLIVSFKRTVSSWIDYFSDAPAPDLPDNTREVADPFVRRRKGPPVRRNPAVQVAASRAISRRRIRQRRMSRFLLIGIALLIPMYVGYNVWIDVLAERRTIRVHHETSDGTEGLPRVLTGDMTIVTDGSVGGASTCSATLRWVKAGTQQYDYRTISDPRRIKIMDVLRSEGIKDSPHYDHYPVSLTTKGCDPWRVEMSR